MTSQFDAEHSHAALFLKFSSSMLAARKSFYKGKLEASVFVLYKRYNTVFTS